MNIGAGQEAHASEHDGNMCDGNNDRDKSRSFTAKLLGPLRIPCKIFQTDSRPGILNRLGEVLQHKWGLQELLCFDAEPSHLNGAGIAW